MFHYCPEVLQIRRLSHSIPNVLPKLPSELRGADVRQPRPSRRSRESVRCRTRPFWLGPFRTGTFCTWQPASRLARQVSPAHTHCRLSLFCQSATSTACRAAIVTLGWTERCKRFVDVPGRAFAASEPNCLALGSSLHSSLVDDDANEDGCSSRYGNRCNASHRRFSRVTGHIKDIAGH